MSDSLKKTVKERYAAAARMVQAGEMGSCCTAGGCFASCDYTPEETKGLPRELLNASLGCGNSIALADLNEGEVVLDLGSRAGLDVLLSARRVGPKGVAEGFIAAALRCGVLPARICAYQPEVMMMLQPAADKLGIALKPTKQLKAFEMAKQAMIRDLAGRGS
ncbi:MAG: DUF6930 domain-containing protein [Moorellaceae bacterium]